MTDPIFLKHAPVPYGEPRVPGVKRTYCGIEVRIVEMGGDPAKIEFARSRAIEWGAGSVTCSDCRRVYRETQSGR